MLVSTFTTTSHTPIQINSYLTFNLEAEMARNRIKELRTKEGARKWEEFL